MKYRPKYNKDPNDTFDIKFSPNDEAMFKEHPEYLYNNGGEGSRIELPDGFKSRSSDKYQAKKLYKEKYNKDIPKKYELEHDNDLKTMLLVKEEVHGSVAHTGGNAKSKHLREENKNKDSNVKVCTKKGKAIK